MNLCYPDRTKSCAACCGLYNVADATRPTLERKLKVRTDIFRSTPRTATALIEFEQFIRESEENVPLDDVIHVCEFTGFIDAECKTVGCLLHPTAPGNGGIDLRGLCHYGSMACKAFFCPACESLESARGEIVINLVDDWHLYGLVATDVDFVESLFRLIERGLQQSLTWGLLSRNPYACRLLGEMLRWKNDWPGSGDSLLRQSRYYFKRSEIPAAEAPEDHVERLLACIRFTFGRTEACPGERQAVEQMVERFLKAFGF